MAPLSFSLTSLFTLLICTSSIAFSAPTPQYPYQPPNTNEHIQRPTYSSATTATSCPPSTLSLAGLDLDAASLTSLASILGRSSSRGAWDNLSTDHQYTSLGLEGLAASRNHALMQVERDAFRSHAHCRALCLRRRDCVQFAYQSGRCRVSDIVRLGRPAAGGAATADAAASSGSGNVWSGWLVGRVRDRVERADAVCGSRYADWFPEA